MYSNVVVSLQLLEGIPSAQNQPLTLCVLYLHCRVQAMAMQEEKLQRKREAGELAREVREQKLADERAEQVVSLQVCMLHTLYY